MVEGAFFHGTEPRPDPHVSMASLLPEKAAAGADGFVHIGNLRVEAGLYEQFRKAMIYESKNPETTAIVKALIESEKPTIVVRTADGHNGTQGFPARENWREYAPVDSAKVSWDPTMMRVSPDGGRQSSATMLGHELDHADKLLHHTRQVVANLNLDLNEKDRAYHNPDEKSVIAGWETRTAKILGEDPRTTHDTGHGKFKTADVTSINPIVHRYIAGEPVDLQPGVYRQSGTITAIDKDRDRVTQSVGGREISYSLRELAMNYEPRQFDRAFKVGESFSIEVKPDGFSVSSRMPGHELYQQPHAHQATSVSR